MEDKEINPTESLAIINAMIDTAKNKLADDGFHFIFWGWLITACSVITYFGERLQLDQVYWVWIIFPPLGGIVSMIYGYKHSRSKKVITIVDSYIGYLTGAFAISLVLTLGFMPVHGIKASYFFLMILYGVSTFVTGGILSFTPLIVGSLFSFAMAALSVFMSNTDQSLCIAAALLCSHIIPGHLLRSAYKSQNV